MITPNMFYELNSMIQRETPFLRIISKSDSLTGRERFYYSVELQKTKYVDNENHPLNITREFIEDVEDYLNEKDVKIAWNNVYTTFWEIE